MKKWIWTGLLTLTLIIGWTIPPVQAQLKYAALSVAQSFTALQTFSGGAAAQGLTLVGTTNTVTDGFKKDAGASGSLDTYKGGVLAWQNRGDHVIMTDCPIDTSAMEFGSFCKDLSSGTIKYRDAGGVKALP